MRGIIGSSLEKFRESIRSPFIDGERTVARTQASVDAGNLVFALWKPGILYLTQTRLLFYQGDNPFFRLLLSTIEEIKVVERRWVSKKTCQQLELRTEPKKGARTIHLRIEPLERWNEWLEQRVKETSKDVADTGH